MYKELLWNYKQLSKKKKPLLGDKDQRQPSTMGNTTSNNMNLLTEAITEEKNIY